MEEPETLSGQESEAKSAKKGIATVLTLGIIAGFLIILFAVTIMVINIIPGENKLAWLLAEATIGNWILLVGAGLIEFFLALVLCIYIWKRGRNFLIKYI